MDKKNTHFNISSTNYKHDTFSAACSKMEHLLNKHISIQNYSRKITHLDFTFTFLSPKDRFICYYKSLQNTNGQTSLKINLPIEHPDFFELDEDTMYQYMIETFLESAFVASTIDSTFKEKALFNDIKILFYRYGWLTRIIFPAAS